MIIEHPSQTSYICFASVKASINAGLRTYTCPSLTLLTLAVKSDSIVCVKTPVKGAFWYRGMRKDRPEKHNYE